MVKYALVGLLVVLSLYVLGGVLLTVNQRDLLYFPTPRIAHHFDTEQFENGSERLSVIVLNPGREKALLYFGGNGESVARTALQFQSLQSDRTIYLMNYRGYGASSGAPTEAGLMSDANAFFSTLAARHASIAVMGRSLGSGIAVALAAEQAVDSLILVAPYDSIADRAAARFPIYPIRWLLHDHFDSLSRAGAIQAPTLIMMAENDEVIPQAATVALFDAMSPRVLNSAVLDDTGHNTLSNHPHYFRYIEDHLSEH